MKFLKRKKKVVFNIFVSEIDQNIRFEWRSGKTLLKYIFFSDMLFENNNSNDIYMYASM